MGSAISVLDKVAFFVYDYCKLTTPDEQNVSFRSLWGGNETMRKDLRVRQNPHLFALFGLSRDVSKGGDWERIYDYRNALEHRFLILHEFQSSPQKNVDVPRTGYDSFLNDTILATRVARYAIMYLILFVQHEEQKVSDEYSGRTTKIPAVRLDDANKYRPEIGNN